MSGSAQLSRDDSLNARHMALGSGLSAGFRRVPPGLTDPLHIPAMHTQMTCTTIVLEFVPLRQECEKFLLLTVSCLFVNSKSLSFLGRFCEEIQLRRLPT